MVDLNKFNYIFKVSTYESNVYRILRRIKPLSSIYSTEFINGSSTTVLRFLIYILRVDYLNNNERDYFVERNFISLHASIHL